MQQLHLSVYNKSDLKLYLKQRVFLCNLPQADTSKDQQLYPIKTPTETHSDFIDWSSETCKTLLCHTGCHGHTFVLSERGEVAHRGGFDC